MYDKIYSRPRIRLPRMFRIQTKNKNGKTDKTKKAKVVKIMAIFVIAFATVKFSLDAVNPIFDTICLNRAETIATTSANDQATNVMKRHTYSEMFKIEKDANENITMISSNIITINEITSDIAMEVEKDLNSKGKETISIALRKLYRSKAFSRSRARS